MKITEETTLGELREILAQKHVGPLVLLIRDPRAVAFRHRSVSTDKLTIAEAINALLRKVGA